MVQAEREFTNHWRVVLASMIGVGLGLSSIGATYTLGLFVVPLSAEFGWTRGQIMTVVMVLTLGIIPSGLAVGWLCDRLGAFRLIVLSQLGLGCCFVALGLFTTSLAALYGIYFLMSVLASGTLPITFCQIVSARFERQRGLALGITLCGTGVAAATVPLYATAVMEQLGWRAAYIAIGVLPIVIALPLSLVLLREKAPIAHGTTTPNPPQAGASLGAALRSYRFWILGAAFFLISGVVTGVLTSLVPLLVERGFEPTWAAGLLGFFGVTVIVGRLGAGILFDRLWAPLIAVCFLAPAAIGLVALAQDSVGTAGVVAAVLTMALATGMELDLSAFLTARYFGRRNFGKIYAGVFVMLMVGGGVAAQLTGWFYDFFGSYTETLYGGAACVVVCALLLLTLGRYPDGFAGEPGSSQSSALTLRSGDPAVEGVP